jgi:hypothetical protein
VVAAFPNREGAGYIYLALSLAGGAPRQLLGEPAADEVELHRLWTALHAEFGDLLEHRQAIAEIGVANSERTIPRSVTK